MSHTRYRINKGINKSIEFRGLKAQYIWWLGGVVTGGMIVFAILYISGVSGYVCVPLVLGLGGLGVARVYRISQRYGEFGLMKKQAQQSVPKIIHARSRKLFFLSCS
jgi:Domain of unknown function (DUF4133)